MNGPYNALSSSRINGLEQLHKSIIFVVVIFLNELSLNMS